MEIEAYTTLRAAILKQAACDYKKAVRQGNTAEADALRKWFLSGWGQTLSGNYGEYILSRLNKELKNKKRRYTSWRNPF